MTQDEIIEMAMEAEFVSHGKPSEEESELFVCTDKDIYKFAKLVAEKERTWVGLKPKEIKSCWLGYPSKNGYPPERIQYFYDAVESALRDKNT